MNDIVVAKVASIQRCIKRARDELASTTDFAGDYTAQDAAILNVTRACEQAIDLANHLIRVARLGIPADSGQSFELLSAERIVDDRLATRLKKMVGFRNVAVHQYQDLDIAVVESVIRTDLNDLIRFTEVAIEWATNEDGEASAAKR